MCFNCVQKYRLSIIILDLGKHDLSFHILPQPATHVWRDENYIVKLDPVGMLYYIFELCIFLNLAVTDLALIYWRCAWSSWHPWQLTVFSAISLVAPCMKPCDISWRFVNGVFKDGINQITFIEDNCSSIRKVGPNITEIFNSDCKLQ